MFKNVQQHILHVLMSPTHSFLCKSSVFKLVNKIIFFAMFIYLILISKKTTNSVKAKQFSFKRKNISFFNLLPNLFNLPLCFQDQLLSITMKQRDLNIRLVYLNFTSLQYFPLKSYLYNFKFSVKKKYLTRYIYQLCINKSRYQMFLPRCPSRFYNI